MTDYPGVPRTAFQYSLGFVKFGFLEWGLELFACLPALVVLLLSLPDSIGYFFVALTGATLTKVGDILNRPEQEPQTPELIDDVEDEFSDASQFEVLAFVVGLYIGFSAIYSTTVLVAAVSGWAIGIVVGYPIVAIVVAGLFPYYDDQLLSRTGVSVGRFGGILFGGVSILILSSYGFSVAPIRSIIRRGRPIR